MGLLANKSWLAQDYYNEYLQLKGEIARSVQVVAYEKSNGNRTESEIVSFEKEIHEKVARLRFVLNQLQVGHGIALEDLILLSIGIEPTLLPTEIEEVIS